MSWRGAAAALARRPRSITLRLTLLFAVVAMLAFAAAGAYLYQALGRQMGLRGDADLVDKVLLVRQRLDEYPDLSALARAPKPLLDAMYGREGYVLRLAAADGAILLQSAAPSRPLPEARALAAVPAGQTPTVGDVGDWRSASEPSRLLSAMGALGGPGGTPVAILVSRERSSRSDVLQHYVGSLALAVGVGAGLVAALGFLVVRQGMRPLRQVIAQANTISTHRLNTRLMVEAGPTELRDLGAAFNAMLDRLEDGVERLSRFAADLAHDLRTPINTLMVETQVVLSRPRSNDEYQTLAASNIDEYERLARMIENTLFLARVDNAQLAMAREALDGHAELRRLRDYFDGLAEEAGVTLAVAAPAYPAGFGEYAIGGGALVAEETGLPLEADPILLRRALANLVSNAIAHTPRGGSVRLSGTRVAGRVRIDVENTGPGIAAAHLPHIFDRYYRADPARAASSSAGLGLAIVRAIMHLHGGDVEARSIPGERTTFSLRFGA